MPSSPTFAMRARFFAPLTMREIELKAVVPDETASRGALMLAGARLVFEGRLEDRRYDTTAGRMFRLDHILRLRIARGVLGVKTFLEWKGAPELSSGYKERAELSTGADDPDAIAQILERLGYVVVREIDRQVVTLELGGTIVRFERYPRMDTLVEVEGMPEGIEQTIALMGVPREAFTTDRLSAFVARYEARTGTRAAVSDRELRGDYRFELADA